MSEDELLPTMPFMQGRKLLEELGVTLPEGMAAIPAPDPDLDPQLPVGFGRLTVLSEVESGTGRALLAHDEDLGRTVRIQLLGADQAAGPGLETFVREARILARLQHPGAPSVHDFGTTEDGDLYFVVAQVEGQTLRDALTDEEWSAGRAARVFVKLAELVACAHDRRVAVGDLDPSRILLGRFGEVTIPFWGGASLLADDPGEERITGRHKAYGRTAQIGVLGGKGEGASAAYGSPEQLRGADANERSDIFCLGAVLYELLTGNAAFTEETIAKLVPGGPDPRTARGRRDVPEELAAVVDAALRFVPSERPESVRELLDPVLAWIDAPRRGAAPDGDDPLREARWRLDDLKKAAEALQGRIDAFEGVLD